MTKNEAYRRASTHFLSEEVEDAYDMSEDRLFAFIEDHAWFQVEGMEACDIHELIKSLADDFMELANNEEE